MHGVHLAALKNVPPASGAVVMATGIVSVDLASAGHETLSRILLAIANLVWLALFALFVARAVLNPARFRADASTPGALTAVAASEVLGTRWTLLGRDWAGFVFLVFAVAFWLPLVAPVLRHWVTPTVGVSFMLTVSTESIAVLAATLAGAVHARGLAYAALVPFVLGLGAYVFVLARFDLRQLLTGHGDHWVIGGALAISALAAGRIDLAGVDLPRAGLLALWGAAMVWLPVLVVAEAIRPRLRYDVRRWATVFPLGMYAACSFVVATAVHADALRRLAQAWTWVAAAVWLVVFIAMADKLRA
jgi:tellurite resistance protein TehA-like permease